LLHGEDSVAVKEKGKLTARTTVEEQQMKRHKTADDIKQEGGEKFIDLDKGETSFKCTSQDMSPRFAIRGASMLGLIQQIWVGPQASSVREETKPNSDRPDQMLQFTCGCVADPNPVGKAIRELGTCVITQKGETVVDTSFGDEEPVAQV
ncbi:hypothetical protein SCA6_012112, partial [Theobroma cacao]